MIAFYQYRNWRKPSKAYSITISFGLESELKWKDILEAIHEESKIPYMDIQLLSVSTLYHADGTEVKTYEYKKLLRKYANLMREYREYPEELEEAVNAWDNLVSFKSEYGISLEEILSIRESKA